MKISICLFFALLLVPGRLILAQTKLDSILINTRTMERTLTVYKGEWRITPGYQFHNYNNRYDQAGGKVHLAREDGVAMFSNTIFADIQYGVTSFMDIDVKIIQYTQRRERYAPVFVSGATFWNPGAGFIDFQKTYITRGLNDILVKSNLRIPNMPRAVDIALTPGISLPSAKHDPEQPEHVLDVPDFNAGIDGLEDGESGSVDYLYINHWGHGVTSAYIGNTVKWRGKNIAVTNHLYSVLPLKTGETYYWKHSLEGGVFSYSNTPYSYDINDVFVWDVLFEYQAYPWMDIMLHFNKFSAKNGWSDVTGEKIAFMPEKINNVIIGYELIVTPRLWFRQQVLLPLSGQNTVSAFSIDSKFVFSL